MIKTTSINLKVTPGAMIYLDIDNFRFIKDAELFNVIVQIENQGEFEYLDEIEVTESNGIVKDYKELERVALNWIFKNVEIVKEG